jgi:hypothetical protein
VVTLANMTFLNNDAVRDDASVLSEAIFFPLLIDISSNLMFCTIRSLVACFIV